MLILRLLAVATVLLGNGNGFYTCHADSNADSESNPDVLASDLIDWLRTNGAYINEKLVVRHLVPGDSSSPRGIFATADIDAGETVCSIPSKLIVKSRDDLMKGIAPEMAYCGTIKAVMEAMSGNDITPYGRYLLAQPKRYIARFWSDAGRELLMEMLKSTRAYQLTKYDELPPHGVGEALGELEEECGGDIDDPLYLQAATLVQARGDYEFMVPFYDMINHDNGKYNTHHKFDHYKKDKIDETGHELIATEVIHAGEQLYNSYNQCNVCQEHVDWIGTPEMFLWFGFVESMPQRWMFDFARVKFDLDWKDGDETTGELVVKFLVPPSEKGMRLLQVEIGRLDSFSMTHRSKSYEEFEGMTEYEWDSLWHYFDALHSASSNALQSNATLSDDVWKLDDNWWVQDGTLAAADDLEHYVLPTQTDKVTNDEL